nr:hypothetical protein [bacterium]
MKKNAFTLFFASFIILFIELTLIRYLSSNIHLLGFFSNTVLLASFLGMGIGCLLKKRFGSSDYIFPFLIIGLIIASIIFYQKNIYLSLGGMTSKSDIFFGGIFYPRRVLKIPIYPALAAIFILVTFILILPARYLGIYFDKFKPLTAYKYNILGSIFGIAFFSLFSYFSVNPFWWFLIIFIVCGFIIEFRIKKIVLWILCLILALAALY